jgi:ATP-dependent helicase/nuclease subunit A
MTAELPDAAARQEIAGRLDRTLFVEAGAGSGKTRSLVDRVVAIVLSRVPGVPLRHVAAVTFTEKAGAELRDRLRVAFESALGAAGPGSERAVRAAGALDDLDAAAIGTLHSFAERILGEHPVEAGLPPLIEVRDEVASGVAFDNRWTVLRTRLLDDPALAPALLLAMSAGMRLEDLRSMALAFNDNWDLLEPRVLATPPPGMPPVEVAGLITEARRLAGLRDHCTGDDDKFLSRLDLLAGWAARLETAADDPARIAVLAEASALKWGYGRQPNWPSYGLPRLKAECAALATQAAGMRAAVLETALRRLARRIAEVTLEAARARRAEGQLEFHDLLVLARDLLNSPAHGPAVRAALQQRYQRMLLDEFQDSDPIQVELAVRIAAGADGGSPGWADVPVPEGSLFLVGDPKQSIYRFRRADIATYLKAQQRIGDQIVLQANFRTTAPVLAWINHVFSQLIIAEPGTQPAYHPLEACRSAAPAGPAVTLLGAGPHEGRPSADELRTREAADVAAAVRTALSERWQVAGEHRLPDGRTWQRWRDVQLRDIAVLIPARTSLPHLEDALDAAGIPYRAEASSLVYRTREVRDLLAAGRAADDPSDPLALVAALRSPLFGCGDDDLWTWQQASGRWNILAPPPDTVAAGHPVRDAVTYLRHLHNDRTWLAPSEVLGRLAGDRRMLEVAVSSPRARDVWRRLRFVIDQARAWAEAEHGGLRAYLAWAGRQGQETTRVAEAVLPETDTDTLRIMTVHAAKGLEFPVVILSGMSSQPGGLRGGVEVLWPPDGGCAFRLRRDVQTGDFDTAKPVDEQMDSSERVRLLYVACTRARDHLIVSLHRRNRQTPPAANGSRTSAELLAGACAKAPSQVSLGAAPVGSETSPRPRPATQPSAYEDWHRGIMRIRERAARPAAVSASQLEGSQHTAAPRPAATDRAGEPADPGLAKDARDLELPPWNKGRYGTAIGRAVHGVLQTVDLASGRGLDDAVAAQVLAEGVAQHAGIVAQLARAALGSATVQRAASGPHWRETYVGTVIGDRVLEGFIDLIYRDNGLVIVDYKTDTVPAAALDQRAAFYRPQLAAYAAALHTATQEPVTRCILVFLSPGGAVERSVEGIEEAATLVRDAVRSQ